MKRLYEKLEQRKKTDEILTAFRIKKGKRKIQQPYSKKKAGFFD